jgi:hypothetical protein
MKTTGLVSTVVLALYSLTPELDAHGFEGDRFFPPTITTDDPFAVDEFAFPTISVFNNPAEGSTPKTREIDFSSEFDKEIFPKFALGIVAILLLKEMPNIPPIPSKADFGAFL